MQDPTQFFGPCYRDELTSVSLTRHGEHLPLIFRQV